MILSNRLQIEDGVHPVHEKLEALKNSGKKILNLTASNPAEAGFPLPSDLIIWDERMKEYLPDSRGVIDARQILAKIYNNAYSPDDFFLTSGTSEAYSFLIKLLCDPGDSILVPVPSYPLFEIIADLEGVKSVFYELRLVSGKWGIDFTSLKDSLSSQVKMIVVVNPNNPTGMLLTQEEMEQLVTIAEEHRIPLIVDEVFSAYVFSNEYLRIRSRGVPVFLLNGISKLLGLPQMKLSWIIVDADETYKKLIVRNLEIITDTYLSVSHIVQYSLKRLFNFQKELQQSIWDRLNLNYQYLKDKKNSEVFLPEAGWYALVKKKDKNDETFVMELLDQYGVYVYPGSMFGFQESGFVIVSLLTNHSDFKQGMELLLQ